MSSRIRALIGAVLVVLSQSVFAGQVDINSADAEVIAQTMLGIGPQKAVEIVRYRSEHGPFTSIDALAEVKGIGAKTIDQNRGRIVAILPESDQ